MTIEKNTNFWKIPLYKIYTDEEDLSLITKIVKRGTNWAIGPEIEEFENMIANYLGCDYCLSLNSGTSALHATLLSYGIKTNDEIIVPSFSFIATANAVGFVNARPIFADIEEDTFGLEPTSITSKISNKTKAVIPMDYGGLPCKIFDIKHVTDTNNLILIEDSAEALGSKINGKKVGTTADSSIFSFCGNKVLTTGEGGAVVTNDKEIYEKIKLIRSHGRVDVGSYFENSKESQYISLGYNWRMSSITASLGISQLSKLDKIISKRQENAKYISERLSKIKQISVPTPPRGYDHIYQMYTIRLDNKKTRDELKDHLEKKRIFSKVYFNPIHLTTYYKQLNENKTNPLPVTERVSDEVLTLPLYPNMTNEEKTYLIDSIFEFFDS
ncbi:DegT/DnrJ/EryC1/StrS family aminotransferase [Nitrosopumilus sp. S4]